MQNNQEISEDSTSEESTSEDLTSEDSTSVASTSKNLTSKDLTSKDLTSQEPTPKVSILQELIRKEFEPLIFHKLNNYIISESGSYQILKVYIFDELHRQVVIGLSTYKNIRGPSLEKQNRFGTLGLKMEDLCEILLKYLHENPFDELNTSPERAKKILLVNKSITRLLKKQGYFK